MWFRMLVALAEDWRSIPRTLLRRPTNTCNSHSRGSNSSGLLRNLHLTCAHREKGGEGEGEGEGGREDKHIY